MKKTAVILYTFVFLVLSAPALRAQDRTSRLRDTAESLLVDAVQAYDSGATKAAMDRFSAILEAFPVNFAGHFYQGMCHARLGDIASGLKEISEAVRLAPDNYWYRDRLATLYAMNGQDDQAVATYEALLADFPRKTEIHYSLVNLYVRQNRLDKVLETLDEIERVMGRDETTALARYDILMHQDKAAEAFSVLEEFNEDFPTPQVLAMMGDSKAAADEDSLAMAYYDQALALDSGYAPALLGKSEVYRMNRSFDGFFNTLEEFVSSPSIPAQAKSQSEELQAARDQLGRLREQMDTLQAASRDQAAFAREMDELRQKNAEMEKELEQSGEKYRQATEQAEEYALVKERVLKLELNASHRAVEIEQNAARRAEELVQEAEEQSARVRQEREELLRRFRGEFGRISRELGFQAELLDKQAGQLVSALREASGSMETGAARIGSLQESEEEGPREDTAEA